MSRNPRAGTCPGAPLTKTEQLRQARTAALLKDYEQKQAATSKHQADPFKVRRRMVRPEPKKVDFTKPGMTKTMLARLKHAQKFQEQYERKREVPSERIPKRTAAPIGGDARMGRERVPGRGRHTSQRTSPARREFEAGPSRLPSPKRGPTPRTPRSPEQSLSRKTTELARMMNADVVQAEPIGGGPISNIVIPPGIVNENKTTIVSIVQPVVETESKVGSQVANRSIQVISETLDDQDAAEFSAVQGRLSELQQARRDFVIAVANVGGNALNLEDETPPSLVFDSPPASPMYQTPQRQIMRVPELEDEFLQPKYGKDHPDVIAAREFMQARAAAKRVAAAEHISDDLHIDIPFEEELFQERDISREKDESSMAVLHPSRGRASPVSREQFYQHEPFNPEELERFFDIQNYPPCPQCGPPPGREHLHPDLWELDDPWALPPPQPDMPDLMEFDLIDFD